MASCYHSVELPLKEPPPAGRAAWEEKVESFRSEGEYLLRGGVCSLSMRPGKPAIEIDGEAHGDALEELIHRYVDLFDDVEWNVDEVDTGTIYPRRIHSGQLQATSADKVTVPGRYWYEYLTEERAMRREKAAVVEDRGPRAIVDLPLETWLEIERTLRPQGCAVLLTVGENG